jgi:hypothetical protein
LARARVAILLVSHAFLASDFIATVELPSLLEAAEEDGAIIMPLIVGPSLFTDTPSLSRFQAVNSPSRPLARLERWQQDEVFVNLAR